MRVAAYGPSGERVGDASGGGAREALARVFLPRNFPASVPRDYAKFQLYDTMQALCSYVRGSLTAKAMLVAAGVGDASASAMSAFSVFLLRDMVSHAAGLLFSAGYCASFQARAKQWRLFADLANSGGLVVELLAPTASRFGPGAFAACAALGSVLRAICGAAAGSARAAFTAHFARMSHDPADVAAKENTQETAATLVGMALGWWASAATENNVVALWAVFGMLTIAHAAFNVLAVRAIELSTLDAERMRVVARLAGRNRALPSPAEVARHDALLPPMFVGEAAAHAVACIRGRVRVSVGADVRFVTRTARRMGCWPEVAEAFRAVDEPFVLCPLLTPGGGFGTIAAVIRRGAGPDVVVNAAWAAARLAETGRPQGLSDRLFGLSPPTVGDFAKAGWDVRGGVAGEGGNRAEWGADVAFR